MHRFVINQFVKIMSCALVLSFTLACASRRHTHQENTTTTIIQHDTIRINECDNGEHIAILSASVNNFYRQCGNNISLDVPREARDISLDVSSGLAMQSNADKRKFRVVPQGVKCELNIGYTLNGARINKTRSYQVINPPRPQIMAVVNGQEHNAIAPISSKSRVVVRVKSDNEFKAAMPNDAKYQISRVYLLAQRSLGAPTRVGTFSGEGQNAENGVSVNFGNALRQDPPGTKVYIQIEKLYRINCDGARIEVPMADKDLVLSFVIK